MTLRSEQLKAALFDRVEYFIPCDLTEHGPERPGHVLRVYKNEIVKTRGHWMMVEFDRARATVGDFPTARFWRKNDWPPQGQKVVFP